MSPLLLAWLSVASATSAFDPTTPDQTFTALETYTTDGLVRLWAFIERHRDPNPELFGPQDFNTGIEWAEDNAFMPFIDDCFGTQRPDADAFLLHVGLRATIAEGTPILLVHGAGDNGSRGFSPMAFHFDTDNRPVYAITFSHPHGDVFQQAEAVANAISRVKELSGVDEIDVVSHSKGGIATAIYLSHTADAEWGQQAYETWGTPYRGDVRKAVFIATPLGGVDTVFRWPANNFAALDPELAVSPASWDRYYPMGVGVPLNQIDLTDVDVYPGGRDVFPGQRQLLAAQDAPLPGSLPWLGAYALAQQDWLTTWNGGYGFVSHSRGIEAAANAAGRPLDHLAANGVDPSVELYLLAGRNPLLTNGTPLLADGLFQGLWDDIATASVDVWGALVSQIVGDTFTSWGVTDAEVAGLAQGNLVLGEITAPSDGLVFVDSALKADTLTARGAAVRAACEADLSHLDLLYASPITGQLLIGEEAVDPVANAWMGALGRRYVEADTLGWLDVVLADGTVQADDLCDPATATITPPDEPMDTGLPPGDTDTVPDDEDPPDDTLDDDGPSLRAPGAAGGGCACGTGIPSVLWLAWLAPVLLRRRSPATR